MNGSLVICDKMRSKWKIYCNQHAGEKKKKHVYQWQAVCHHYWCLFLQLNLKMNMLMSVYNANLIAQLQCSSPVEPHMAIVAGCWWACFGFGWWSSSTSSSNSMSDLFHGSHIDMKQRVNTGLVPCCFMSKWLHEKGLSDPHILKTLPFQHLPKLISVKQNIFLRPSEHYLL